MGENSNIEWTHHTLNAWIGCTKVGPGCDNCYAAAWDARGLQGQETRWGAHATRTRTATANWRKPLAWDSAAAKAGERHRVFCSSLADVFDNHPSILPEWRADLWALIRVTPNLDWMLLTKRPGNIAKMLPPDWGDGYPNVWLGCTVVNQEEADRDVPKLLAVPAAVRFLSMEPLLGPVDLTGWFYGPDTSCGPCPKDEDCECGWQMRRDLPDDIAPGQIDLVIVGGESGPRARPMNPDWARSLRDQCVAAGVPFFFKQWVEWEADQIGPEDARSINHPPGHVIYRRVGKKAAGRLLDGRTWDQMPGGDHA